MTVTLELGPEEVTALQRRAEAEGVDIQTVLHRLIAQIAPPPAPEIREKQKGVAAPGQAWRQEDEMDDPEELAERDREREEVEANLNRWRAEQGRPLADRGGRPGMNGANEENPWVEMVEGVRRRTTVSGRAMSQMVVTLEAGRHLPEHRHPQEQIVHVVRGRLRLSVGGVGREVGAGESLYLAGDVPHSVDVLAEALVVDTFSPPREDLLAQDRAAGE